MLLPFLMVAWILGAYGYMAVAFSFQRGTPWLAHLSLLEYFLIKPACSLRPSSEVAAHCAF